MRSKTTYRNKVTGTAFCTAVLLHANVETPIRILFYCKGMKATNRTVRDTVHNLNKLDNTFSLINMIQYESIVN